MKPKLIISGFLILGIIFLEYGVMDDLPEKKYEAEYTDITKIPPTSALPQYIGSLFLGAFRAVAIDILWINYGQEKQARRYYEAKEIVELISHLQPRNEAVWDFIAWDVAYNLSLGELYFAPEQWWKWVKYGLLKMHEGIAANKKSPYLKYGLAYMLTQKSYIPFYMGVFRNEFIEKVEGDKELQEILSEGQKDARISPFCLAIEWFERTKRDLDEYEKESKSKYYTVRGGILYYVLPGSHIISKDIIDVDIREALYHQAILCWHRKKYSQAVGWLDRAIEHAQKIVKDYPTMGREGFSGKFVRLYKQLKDVLPIVESNMLPNKEEGKIVALERLEQILGEFGSFEDGFIYQWVSQLKKHLRGDEFEYNDNPDYATSQTLGEKMSAAISPTPHDIDFYVLGLQRDSRLKLRVSTPEELNLDALILDREMKEVAVDKEIITGGLSIIFSANEGPCYIKIFATKDGKWSREAKYELEITEDR